MERNIVESALEFVKNFFEGEASGHDYYHTYRVFKIAQNMAKNNKTADCEICELGALLHDVDDIKISPTTYENKDNARNFLLENNYPINKIDFICKIIDDVSFRGKDSVKPQTIEGMIVQDADRLDAIGAIGIARTFAYGGSHGREIYNPDIKPVLNQSKEQYHKSNSPTINHFYEKLLLLKDMMNTEEGKKIAEQRTQYMKEYLDEFFAEWNGER